MIKVFQTDEQIVARAWSFFWIKRVVIGSLFWKLPFHIRNAVMAHEEGHAEMHHTEWRVVCLLFAPWMIFDVCKQHELDADLFAASRGHGAALIEFLKFDKDCGLFHPSHAERRQHLERYEYPRFAGETSTRPCRRNRLFGESNV